MHTTIEWAEPDWSRRAIWLILRSTIFDNLRSLRSISLWGLPIAFVVIGSIASITRLVEPILYVGAHILAIIIGGVLVLVILHTLLSSFLLPNIVRVMGDKIIVSGQEVWNACSNQSVAIMRDDAGHDWLVVKDGKEDIRIGIDPRVDLAGLSKLLHMHQAP